MLLSVALACEQVSDHSALCWWGLEVGHIPPFFLRLPQQRYLWWVRDSGCGLWCWHAGEWVCAEHAVLSSLSLPLDRASARALVTVIHLIQPHLLTEQVLGDRPDTQALLESLLGEILQMLLIPGVR